MDVIPYEPALLPAVTASYNQAIRGVPHCYPVSAEELGSSLAVAAGGGQSHKRLHCEAMYVAGNGTSILGFIHVATERPKREGEAERGVVRFLTYERGHRAAGQALLDAAHDHFRERQLSHDTAFWQDYRYPFYHLEHAYLSDRLGHVAALLGLNGYEKVAGEVYLDWADYEPVEPSPSGVPAEISVDWRPGRGKRPGVEVKAFQGGRQIGTCRCVSCGDFSRAEAAQEWFLTVWLGVDDKFQGRGLGRHLLQRAHLELHGVGYRHAAISTNWRNFRAFLFYSNSGYRVADWTHGWGREL